MKRRAASVAEVRRTTEADRSSNEAFHPPGEPISPWVAIDTNGYRFFEDNEHEARAACEKYNGLRSQKVVDIA